MSMHFICLHPRHITVRVFYVAFSSFLRLDSHILLEVTPLSLELSLSLLVFNVTCNDISVIYVTAQMCKRTEEEVIGPTVGLPTP